MKGNVLFIGAGKLGRALGGVIASRGVTVSYWDAAPGAVPDQRPLEDLVPAARTVFFCVPTKALAVAARAAAPHLKKGAIAVCVSKGLEEGTARNAREIVSAALPRVPFVFLGGPLLAGEIGVGKPGIGVAASKDRAARDHVAALFKGTPLAVETSADADGVVWSAILKNIYAVALGIAEGLGWGSNAKGWLTSEATIEADALIILLGGKRGTFIGTAGLGDFVATGFSPLSMNRTAGEEIARTGRCIVGSEGCLTLPMFLKRLGAARAAKFPLLGALRRIIVEARPASETFSRLLA
jgi:glycerol-3-phosphate dehydrogenase (NAD(P)+)